MGLTALLLPCQYHCAFKNADAMELCTTHDYYMLANLSSYASGVVPAGVVQQGECGSYLKDTVYQDKIAKAIAHSELGSEGMPIGLMVMTP